MRPERVKTRACKIFSLLKLDALNIRKSAFIVSIQRDPVLWMGKLCEFPFTFLIQLTIDFKQVPLWQHSTHCVSKFCTSASVSAHSFSLFDSQRSRKPKLRLWRFLPWVPHLFCVGWGRRRDQPQDIAFTSRKGQVQGWGNNSSTGLFSVVLDAFYITSVVSCSLLRIYCNPAWMVGFSLGDLSPPMCSLQIGLEETWNVAEEI